MKKLVLIACLAALSVPALQAQSASAPSSTTGTTTSATSNTYALFKIEDANMKLRTSDGAEAGEIQYLVVDPTSQRVVSALVSGGITKEKIIAVPFAALPTTGGREMTLTTIDRERFQNAPSIERSTLTRTQTISRDLIDRSSAHFGTGVSRAGESTQPEPVASGPQDRRSEPQPNR